MIDSYAAVRKFIRDTILQPQATINRLATTRSARLRITRRFEQYGWTVQRIGDPTSKYPKNSILSPDGSETLQMIDGKVFRHPETTDLICRRKHLTKRMLDLAGVANPDGGDFGPEEKEVATAFFDVIPKPVVVKPSDSGSSRGVTVGVATRKEFSVAWDHALDGGRKGSNVLVEEFVEGIELRAFVVGDELLSIVARVQPFVVGDGRHSVAELLLQAEDYRNPHYRARKMPITANWPFIAEQGHSPESVPDEGHIILVNPFTYPTIGAYYVEVTSIVPPAVVDMARRAVRAIPGLEIGGVDILIKDVRSGEGARVVEVNTAASLEFHRYPTHGNARAIEEDIVDYFHRPYQD